MNKEQILEILKNKTEDNEMVQGDVVSYVPDWEFEEIADSIISLPQSKTPITEKGFTKEDMINFAHYLRNGLTNIEYGAKNIPEHLEDFIKTLDNE